MTKRKQKTSRSAGSKFRSFSPKKWWRLRSKLTKVMLIIGCTLLVLISPFYSIAVWYRWSHRNEPMQWGVSWSAKTADDFGIDRRAGLTSILQELPIQRVRLMSYWDLHEPINGQYDWTELDWQFDEVEKHGKEISLAIGLRQPRWPECHWPEWAQQMRYEEWKVELADYIKAVVERYDNRANLTTYQLENEFFLTVFGECPDFTRQRLIDEYNLVKSITSKHVAISRSNNVLGWPVGEPEADGYAVSVYKRVLDQFITDDYFEYPLPAWFYGFLGGISEITQGKQKFFIHELQSEPWGTRPTDQLNIAEQNETMDARRLKARLKYGHDSGIRTIDIWGVEWFYWRKTFWQDDSLWRTIQTELPKYD